MRPRMITATRRCAGRAGPGCVRRELDQSSARRARPAPRLDRAASTTASSAATATSSAGEIGYEGVPLEVRAPDRPASTTQTGDRGRDPVRAGRAARLPHPRPPGGVRRRPAVLAAGRDRNPRLSRRCRPARARSLPAASASTGCTPTPPTASSTSSRRPSGSTRSGDFFDEWHQPLTRRRRSAALHGKITAFFNGKLVEARTCATIPLLPHAADPVQHRRARAAADDHQLDRGPRL